MLSGFSCENNIVQGNIIGLQVGGILGAGNDEDGIQLFNARNNLIGGPLLPDPSIIRNIIGSNGGAGCRAEALDPDCRDSVATISGKRQIRSPTAGRTARL